MNLKSFVNYLTTEKRYSHHTVREYQHDVSNFLAFVQIDATHVTLDHVRKYQQTLSGQAPASRSRRISAIKSFYRYLQLTGHVANNPCELVINPKQSKKLPDFLTSRQIELLFDPYLYKQTFEGRKERMIVEMFLQTGVRKSELINLKISDFDTDQEQVRVQGKGNKERLVPVLPRFANLLREYIEELRATHKSKYLFPNPEGKRSDSNYISSVVQSKMQMVTHSGHNCHKLRHTFASQMLKNGANLVAVRDLLGHSSLKTTQIYTHVSMEDKKKAYLNAHPRQ